MISRHAVQYAWISGRAIVLHQFMQSRQCMVRHQREHVVLDVVIHVPVEIPVDRVHVDRAAIEPVVENVFGQSGVLSKAVDEHQPGAESGWAVRRTAAAEYARS